MDKVRRPWVRGALTLAVLALFGAAALISNAGAVAEKKEASKKFVKKKVKGVAQRVAALEGMSELHYVQGPQVSVTDPGFGQAEAVCPPGYFATGGGGSVSQAAGAQVDSYPSQGVGFTLGGPAAPIGHTAWTFEYATGGADETIRAFVICMKVRAATGYVPGGDPGRRAG